MWRNHPLAPSSGCYLCSTEEITDTAPREIIFGEGMDAFRIVIFRRGDALFAYHNCCPHFSLPLNYEPQQFHLFDGAIVCAHHTALFRLEDGVCIDGPCTGARLTALPIRMEGGQIYLGE